MNKDRCLLLNKLIINNIYCIFFVFCFIGLLSDAELAEDIAENVIRRDLARDFAQVVKYLADLLANQICRQSVPQSRYGTCQSIFRPE